MRGLFVYPLMAELFRRRQHIQFHIISCQVILALKSAVQFERAAAAKCHLRGAVCLRKGAWPHFHTASHPHPHTHSLKHFFFGLQI